MDTDGIQVFLFGFLLNHFSCQSKSLSPPETKPDCSYINRAPMGARNGVQSSGSRNGSPGYRRGGKSRGMWVKPQREHTIAAVLRGVL